MSMLLASAISDAEPALDTYALYARVSTEEQADRQTVDAQTGYLRGLAALNEWNVYDLYVDDGWSGTLPLKDRPEGRRMLQDAQAHAFTRIIFTRVDRFARSLEVLMDAYKILDKIGITIQSGQEPFDTSTPIGKFLFQLLGSMAELDRATLLDKLSVGRDRVLRSGKAVATLGYGLDFDQDGGIMPSQRPCPEVPGLTESEVVREMLLNLASGASATSQATRLNGLGVRSIRRWPGGKESVSRAPWSQPQVCSMAHNPAYKGFTTYKTSRQKDPIVIEHEGLVSPEDWDRIQVNLLKNKSLAKSGKDRTYLLRGLIRCGCGRTYVGATLRRKYGEYVYYTCSRRVDAVKDPRQECHARYVNASELESFVWAQCREMVFHPEGAMADARRQFRERQAVATVSDARRRDLQRAVIAKEQERERVMTMFRRNVIGIEEAEGQLNASAAEAAALRAELAAVASQADLMASFETQLLEAGRILQSLRGEIEEIEASGDVNRKQKVIEDLVTGILVTDDGSEQRIEVNYVGHARPGQPPAALTPVPHSGIALVPGANKVLKQSLFRSGIIRCVAAVRGGRFEQVDERAGVRLYVPIVSDNVDDAVALAAG